MLSIPAKSSAELYYFYSCLGMFRLAVIASVVNPLLARGQTIMRFTILDETWPACPIELPGKTRRMQQG
jgi:hypothetical protein